MFDYKRMNGVEIRVARIFNTYGPRMSFDDGRVVSNFLMQALQGKPMTVMRPGTQTRSFQYVSDLVDGLIRLMEGPHEGPINIGACERACERANVRASVRFSPAHSPAPFSTLLSLPASPGKASLLEMRAALGTPFHPFPSLPPSSSPFLLFSFSISSFQLHCFQYANPPPPHPPTHPHARMRRQSERVHDRRTGAHDCDRGGAGCGGDVREQHAGRPAQAPPRHHARQGASGLEASHAIGRRALHDGGGLCGEAGCAVRRQDARQGQPRRGIREGNGGGGEKGEVR